jgi:hypothetical protein
MPYNALNGNRIIASMAYSGATAKLARLIQCAPTARNASGERFHPDSCR